jgi:hypothetical protein
MTSAQAPDSRRHFSRVAFHVKAQLLWSEGTQDVQVCDLALKGALVESTTVLPLKLGDGATLRLLLDSDGDQIELMGTIVHTEGARVGLKCQDIDVDSLTNLRRLIELNLGDSSLVDRELSQLFSGR